MSGSLAWRYVLECIIFANTSIHCFYFDLIDSALVMQACNAHGLYCVPLYDTLGINVPTFIMFLDDSTLLSVRV